MQLHRGFSDLPATQRLFEALDRRLDRRVGGLWGASTGLLLACIQAHWQGPILCICADDDEALELRGDLCCFRSETSPVPMVLPTEAFDVDGQPDAGTRSARLKTLTRLEDEHRWLLLASLQALLQPAPARRQLHANRVALRCGEAFDADELFARAREADLRKVPVVLAPGEVSLRGDILDIFPLAASEALRLESFDGELESIRSFDPSSQSSLEVFEEYQLELGAGDEEQTEIREHLLHKDLLVLHLEPLRIEDRRLQIMSAGDGLSAVHERLHEALAKQTRVELSALPSQDLDYKILSAGSAVGSGEADPLGRLRSIRGLRGPVQLICPGEPERKRLKEIFAHRDIDLQAEDLELRVGSLSRGFRIPDLEVTVLSQSEFAGVPAQTQVVEKAVVPSRALKSFFELGPGDTVVHAVHGIARFEGIELVERGEAAEDHLRLIFKDDVRLLVPASKIHLVQKYIGAGGAAIKLDKLGGRSFARRKEDVSQALFDMAADLLDLQAERSTITREPYPRDALEEEMLDAFPFQDTEDQARSWEEIRGDLEGERPMDRLLCGDVGFGKTEVAMRAAFKVAICGKQVAVLVPTTVLAEQHGKTFEQRFAPHGLRVETISRFRPLKERKQVLQDLQLGKVDVLVGTHRLLSKDVRFADLGLMVVDEEQRFGVRHKEHIKQMRRAVDVLTLSATPIPRTLHASLVGIRDISTLSIAPRGRQEVETRLVFKDAVRVARAIQRELEREGQVYLLHNRVASIERVAEEVRQLVPAAKVVVGHGQMTETQMEKALRSFVRGEADVLVCTSIVENGLDIPRANTILIENPDHFGLAELHQLRGRVGRSSRRAHCLLLLDRTRPIGEEARKRLKALEEFSSLGAGFAIAMKDLEIRGAGNLLGPQQSGHIASVGYEMYCQLLQGAVRQAAEDRRTGRSRARPQPEPVREVDLDLKLRAFIPDPFLSDPKSRLELLREMDGARDTETATALGLSIRDRFGPLPEPVQLLLLTFLLKHQLESQAVLGLQWVEAERLVLRHRPEQALGGAWLDRFAAVRPVQAGQTHLLLPKRRGGAARKGWSGAPILRHLLAALLGDDVMPMIQKTWSSKHRSSARQPRGGSPAC